MDSRGVKTELVERLKAALEGKHAAGQEAELAVGGEEVAEAPTKEVADIDSEEVAEVDTPENLGADETGGQKHVGDGKQGESEVGGEPSGVVANDDILGKKDAAGTMSEEDETVKEVDLEEERDAVEDIAEDVPENENETEKSNSLEEEKADDEAQEPTEKSSAADQVAPIGLRELRYV